MDAMERILGRLEEFKEHSEKRFDRIEHKIDGLNSFRWRMTGGAVILGLLVTGGIEVAIRLSEMVK